MESDNPRESHGPRKAPSAEGPGGATGASSGENALPAKLIEGQIAYWIPRAATIGLMTATWLFPFRNDDLPGAQAIVFTFLGSDAPSRTQATYLLSNTISPVLIWTVEANRGGITPKKGILHTIALAAIQTSGIERVAPICYLYSMSTWESVNSSEDLKVPSEEAKAVLPATLFGYVLPAALISLVPLTATGLSRSHFNIQSSVVLAFFLAPPGVSALTNLISMGIRHFERKAGKGGPRRKAFPEDKKSRLNQDNFDAFHSLRSAYAVTFAIQAAQHLYTVARNLIQAPQGQRSVVAVLGDILTYPAIPRQKHSSLALYSAATLGFALYTVWELRRRGKVSDRDATRTAVGVLAGQVLFGPGATYAGLWWWREGVLARTRQRA